MFNAKEKIVLIVTGIETIVICIGIYAIKRSIANKYGISVKDLKNFNTLDERMKLKNKEA